MPRGILQRTGLRACENCDARLNDGKLLLEMLTTELLREAPIARANDVRESICSASGGASQHEAFGTFTVRPLQALQPADRAVRAAKPYTRPGRAHTCP